MNTNENRFSLFSSLFASRNRRSQRPNVRRLAAEQLEERTLLSVSPADYAAIAAAYPDFSLPASQEDINILEVDLTSGADASANLTNLKSAIATAGTTEKPDLIVVHTSETANTITYAAVEDEITIDIGATRFGSIAIVGWGAENLTLDANQLCRVMTVSDYTVANLGGMTITGGISIAYDGGGGIYNSGTLTVTNSTISGNTAENDGGGIYNGYSSVLTVTNSTISENTAKNGGGIYNYDVLTVTNSTISDNTAKNGGGIYNGYHGALTVTNSTISGNTATGSNSAGGGIYNDSEALTITNSTISGNTAAGSNSAGGGIYNNSGVFDAYNTIIACNTASETNNTDIYNNSGTVNGYNSLSSYAEWSGVNNNIAYDSAKPLFRNIEKGDYRLAIGSQAIDKGNNAYAVDAAGNPLEFDKTGNVRIKFGDVDIGAYEYQGIVVNTLEDVVNLDDDNWSLRELISQAPASGTITFDESLAGGTITLSGGELYIDKSLIIDASALAEGITINADQKSRVFNIAAGTADAPVQLIGLSITGGRTTGSGGGIYINSSCVLTVTNSTISGNTAEYNGGGIYINSSCVLTVTNSTISGNMAVYGGGILNYEGALTVTNSTISGNTAEYNGGGILNYEGALTVTNSTISGNTADYGGGIDNNGTLELYNSFVSLNYSENRATNIYGTYSGDNNLIGCHPMFVCDPVFSNGVLTNADSLDFHLRSDSPAIDAGDNSKITAGMTDLNGNARNYGETVDIGAYEYQGDRNDEPIPYSSVVNTLNDSFDLNDEEWSLREAIYWATQYTEITFAEGLEGTITLASGQLIVDKALSIDGAGKITIDASQNSRVMRVEAGTEEQPVVLRGLTITGGEADYGGGIYNYGDNALTITNLTISGNTADNGGGIYNYGDNALTITNLTISGNTADNGGGIYNYGDNALTVTNSTISGNTADNGGGIYNYQGALTVTNSTISGNTADNGGGIYNSYFGALTVTNSTISGNTADYDGGGIYNFGDNALTITNSTISGNTADYNGGGIFNYHSALTVTNSTISGNTATVNGGGIYNYFGDLTVTNSTISGNTASGTNSNGGGIYNNSDALTVNKSIVAMNYASSGYANVYGTLTDTSADNCIDYNPLFVCRPVFDDTGALNNANEADYHLLPYSPWANRLQEGYIGAYEYEGEPTVAPKDFSIVTTLTDEFDLTNDVISLREAIWYVSDEDTTITFAESLFGEENSITLALDSQLQTDKPMAIDGAGRVTIDGQNKTRIFYNTSSLILTRLTISNGKANGNGGGIYNDDGDLTITNSTISGNSADGNGGGIYNDNDGDLTVTNSTISGNTASGTNSNGGGVYNKSGTFTAYNTIVACNTADNKGNDINNYWGTVKGYNSLSSYTSWDWMDSIEYDAEKPLFRSISNGDYRLANGSQAINKGNNEYAVDASGNLLEFDQIGNARIKFDVVDIGAYECQEIVVDTLDDVVDADDGKWSLREALSTTSDLAVITFHESLAGGTITLSGTELYINESLIIDASALEGGITINADQKSGVFRINVRTDDAPVQLIGLNITGGNSGYGGIYNNYGALMVTNSTISGNTADNGGGIYNDSGTLTVTNSTISENTASGDYSYGGGIFNYGGALTVTNSTIAENTAYDGGGIYNEGDLTVTNSTISGNAASNNGGGVFNDYETFDAYNTIIACNTATEANAADIYNYSGTVNGYNSLSSYDEWGEVNNNIIYDSAKPLFRSISNGDYRLAIGSQAIDKGKNAYAVDAAGNPLEFDQAGNARIMFETVDIGAYEYQGIVVDTLEDVVDANDGKWSLRELISQAPASGTITFDESLAGGTITLSGEELIVDKSLVIDASALAGGITINADQKSRVFNIAAGTAEAPVQLIGLSITGGNATDDGGGIYNGSSCVLTVTNSTISGNTAVYDGGGICNYGDLTVTNSTISGNSAENGGGICSEDNALTVANSTITGNTAEYGGGICNYEGALTVTNSIVAQNYASDSHNDICGTLSETSGHNIVGYNPVFAVAPVFDINGTLTNAQTLDLRLTAGSRAINAGSSDVTLTEFDLDGNPRVVGNGVDIGAYEFQETPATEPTTFSTVVDTLEDSFVADDGEWSLREALYWTTGPGTITFDDSIAGGTISLNRRLSVYGMSIDGGLSGITLDAQQKGRAMETTGTVTLNGLTITGGKTNDYGAGICNCDDGDLTVNNCTISGNTATGNYSNGAGICNFGALTVTNSTISDNTASGTKSNGGGICNETGYLTVTNSMISGNTASNGGGICNYYGWLTVTNSTISENTASKGGGINNSGMIDNNYGGVYDRGILTVTNSTISGNTASNGGGIYNDGGALTANNSIIPETIYLDSGVIKGSNNLSSYSAWSSGSNNIVYDPDQALFEDAAYGDYRILPGSQAHNAGSNDLAIAAGLNDDSKDLAGMPRFTDEVIDIGAYECFTVSPMVLNEEIAGNLTAENQYMQGYSFAVDGETTISFSLLQGDWNELFVILYGPDYWQFLTSESGKFTLSEAGTYYLQLQPAAESTEQAYEFCVNFHDVEILSIGVADSSAHATTDVIPDGLTAVTDWDSFYVEFWSESMPGASASQSATAEINYDPTLFTLDRTQTIVCPAGISAVFSESKTEDDGTITVEVTFTVGAEDYTAPGANLYWGCVHFTPTLTDGAGLPDIYSEADAFGAKVKTFAYDLERNGKVDMTDFIEFAKIFNQKVEGNENPLVAVADFNGSGTVDMADFILFAQNFNKKKSDDNVTIVQPERIAEAEPPEPAAAAVAVPVAVTAAVPEANPVIESTPAAIPDLSQPDLRSSARSSRATDEAILDLYENQYSAESFYAVQPESLDDEAVDESDIDETTNPAAPNASSVLEVNRIDSVFTDLKGLDWA